MERMTVRELEDEITTWAGRAAHAEARLLALVGEFDARGGWHAPGLLSCAHWLSWRCGMGLVAARERVRVARALRDLPVTAAAFTAGRLSYSQVRALTRVATPATETDLVELARHATGAQLDRIARGWARSQPPSGDAEDRAHRMRPRVRYDTDGTLVLTLRYPADQAQEVLAGLELDQSVAEEDTPAAPQPATTTTTATTGTDLPPDGPADGRPDGLLRVPAARAGLDVALLHLCRQALGAAPRLPGRTGRRLSVLLDPLSGWARTTDGEFLPPGTVTVPDELTTARLRRGTPADLTAHDGGRDRRLVGSPLRALLGRLDGERCRLPGCTRRTGLHAHHVLAWEDGGRTDLANLVLVCARHHTLIHDGTLTVQLHPDRRLTCHDRDARPVAHHPHQPHQPWPTTHDDDQHPTGIDATTLPPHCTGQPLDLDHVIWVLHHQAA